MANIAKNSGTNDKKKEIFAQGHHGLHTLHQQDSLPMADDPQGLPVTEINISEIYPHLADYLTGNINAFQIIADGIIKEYAEGGSPMEKLIRDLNYIREYFESHDGLDTDLRGMLEKMGVANNKFR